MESERVLLGFGLIGQLLFTGRFIIQWVSSERHGRSVIPAAFWHLSISGAIVLLIYAVLRHDPVFVLGQSTGLLIYLRNLQFIARQRDGKQVPASLSMAQSRVTGSLTEDRVSRNSAEPPRWEACTFSAAQPDPCLPEAIRATVLRQTPRGVADNDGASARKLQQPHRAV